MFLQVYFCLDRSVHTPDIDGEEEDPAPPLDPPPNWNNATEDIVIDININPPVPDGSPVSEIRETEENEIEDQSWFGKIFGKFRSKNLVDGQFEYGIPGLGVLMSAIQSFALWGPNLVLGDALKSIFERALEVDAFILDFDW